MMLLGLGTLAIASSLSLILAQFLVNNLNINLFSGTFSASIPSFTAELGKAKTFDMMYFVMFMVLAALIYGINIFFTSNEVKNGRLLDTAYLIFGALLFFQTHFVRFSGRDAIIYVLLLQLGYLFAIKCGWKKIHFSEWIISANGLLCGFYVMLLIRPFTTSMLWVGGVIITGWLVYEILTIYKYAFLKSPLHLLLCIGIIFPWNGILLWTWGVGVLLIIRIIKKIPEWLLTNQGLLYAIFGTILLAYDPLFYFGNIDSIEEGFWLGWLQHLLTGQVLYKDVAVYHPPLLIWGLDLWTRIVGISVYSVRLYFQVIRVTGVVFIFLAIQKLLKSKMNITLAMLMIMAFLSTQVRNNVEIRIGFGLLSLYLISKKKIFFSGIICALTMGVSLETGIASLLAGSFWIATGPKKWTSWIAGLLVPASTITIVLAVQGSLVSAIKQIVFYSSAFSLGYFNMAIERPELQNILLWWKVDRFIITTGGMWEAVTWFFGITIIYFIYKFRHKQISISDHLAIAVTVFGLIISRAALGRSDWYHLLFILLPGVPLMAYVIENTEGAYKSKFLSISLWLILALIFSREIVQQKFLNNLFMRVQSYANISQRYLEYKTDRSGIALNIDAPVSETDDLIKYIQSNTTKNDKIFVYPWGPEIYFLSDRTDSSTIDTPYAFFTSEYQNLIITQLETNRPKLIIYNPEMKFAGMTPNSLPSVQKYIFANYSSVINFGNNNIYAKN